MLQNENLNSVKPRSSLENKVIEAQIKLLEIKRSVMSYDFPQIV